VRLSRLLKNKKSVAIVVDDPTRPTPVYPILMKILDLSRSAGISDNNVRLIVALGTHLLKDKSLIGTKLKGLLDTEIKVVLPNCLKSKDYVYVGQSRQKIPVFVHQDYSTADVKITISGIYPHGQAGFSGGAKILIGILRIFTLSLFHKKLSSSGAGNIETPFRDELESFADLAGIDYSINIVPNHEKQVHRMWCGDFRTAFRAAAAYAKSRLGIQPEPDADLVLSNAYPLDTSLSVIQKSIWPFRYAKKNSKFVLIASPANLADDRLRRCVSNREVYREAFRISALISLLRRTRSQLKNKRLGMQFTRNPELVWKRDFSFLIPQYNEPTAAKVKAVGSRAVFASWDSLVSSF
jgi:lactate racemase